MLKKSTKKNLIKDNYVNENIISFDDNIND